MAWEWEARLAWKIVTLKDLLLSHLHWWPGTWEAMMAWYHGKPQGLYIKTITWKNSNVSKTKLYKTMWFEHVWSHNGLKAQQTLFSIFCKNRGWPLGNISVTVWQSGLPASGLHHPFLVSIGLLGLHGLGLHGFHGLHGLGRHLVLECLGLHGFAGHGILWPVLPHHGTPLVKGDGPRLVAYHTIGPLANLVLENPTATAWAGAMEDHIPWIQFHWLCGHLGFHGFHGLRGLLVILHGLHGLGGFHHGLHGLPGLAALASGHGAHLLHWGLVGSHGCGEKRWEHFTGLALEMASQKKKYSVWKKSGLMITYIITSKLAI